MPRSTLSRRRIATLFAAAMTLAGKDITPISVIGTVPLVCGRFRRALARGFLELNSLGTVPLFIDGDVRMTESAMICQYLTARSRPTPLDVETGDPVFGAYLNWLHHGEATLTFPQTLVLRYGRFEPEARRQPQVADDHFWPAASEPPVHAISPIRHRPCRITGRPSNPDDTDKETLR